MKLFGTKYKIIFCKRQEDIPSGEKNPYGLIHNNEKIIWIWKAPEIHPDNVLTTYIHEIIHAVTWEQGFELSETKTGLLATGLASWIRENGIKVKIE